MSRHVVSKLDGLDLDTRELLEAAARRAGLSLEDWVAAVLGGRAGGHEAPRRTAGPEAGSDLDSVIARVSRMARRRPGEDYEALMAAAKSRGERDAPHQAPRTAIALESIAAWIEQAEERFDETARASADHQDRIASALSQALATLKGRLDDVERQVVSERAVPARIEFPVQDALKALAPLSETLVGLRTDMSRLAERLEQPANVAWTPAVNGIRADIERLRSTMGGLATREEITTIAHAVRDLARDLEQERPSKDLVTLANSIAALFQQVQTLSDDLTQGMQRHIGAEIDLIKHRIDTIAETGVDRSVIDFLSSQIVDMRQDLANRAEPQQIERLSRDVAALSRQVADLRVNQVGRGDLAALKSSLENVCSALDRTVAAQETSDVPEQLRSLSQRLEILVSRPAPEPANLDPIAQQLSVLTERMASLSSSRLEQADTLTRSVGDLALRIQALAAKDAPSQEPLMRRFDQLEQELRQVGRKADTSSIELMLNSIDQKLDRQPVQASALDSLEQRIMALASQIARTPDEPLHKALDEATAHLRNLHNEAEGIAERVARSVAKDIQTSLPDPADLDALKQGFVELKALQTRADKKTQQTLLTVHEALDKLVARFADQGLEFRPAGIQPPPTPDGRAEDLTPADRLEAAVRRLHTAALFQAKEVSTTAAEAAFSNPPEVEEPDRLSATPEAPRAVTASFSPQEADLGNVRANFIAAARRAAQAVMPDKKAPAPALHLGDEAGLEDEADEAESDEASHSAPSLLERLRRTFEGHRRPLLFSVAFLILAAGTAQILSSGHFPPALASAAIPGAPQEQAKETTARPHEPAASATTGSTSSRDVNLFQGSSLTALPKPPAPFEMAKFVVDPSTVGAIPAQVPAALRQAALSGDAAAIHEIASRAAAGRGLAQDMALAVRLYERAAQAGLPPAQEQLAALHEKGNGVPRDLKMAATWYERAARGGNIRAMHNLATLLASGVNGKPDYVSARRWYGEAAEAGLRDSQFNLGILLAHGIGAKQDLPTAFKWFSLAAQQGDAGAAKKRDEIAAQLAAPDLAAAKASVEQWRPRVVDPDANGIRSPAGGRTAALDRTEGDRS